MVVRSITRIKTGAKFERTKFRDAGAKPALLVPLPRADVNAGSISGPIERSKSVFLSETTLASLAVAF